MIECLEGTVLPVDERVMNKLLHDDYWHNNLQLRFDEDYLSNLHLFHGGTPARPYFTDSSGVVRRIGWFVSLYDEQSELPGERQEDHMYHDDDTRVVDRSLPYLLDGECSIYAPEDPIRFYPFAALYEDAFNDSSSPFTLAWHFGYGNDSVCFDTSTQPFSIVYCNFHKATEAFIDWDSDLDNKYDAGHLIPVTDSFRQFAQMLRNKP